MQNRSRLALTIGILPVIVCLAFGAYMVYRVNQPVVSCGPAPEQPSSLPRPELASAQDYFTQGDRDYARGDCEQAIADYSQAIALNPNFAEAYNNRAYVAMVKRDYAAALPNLDRAIQLRPNYVNARMNRGDIYNYYYAIDYARAVADYDQVLSIDPNAANTTSVCGHRLLAIHHGWNIGVVMELLTHGVKAGCLPSK